MSNLHRQRLQKYDVRVLGFLLENKKLIDKSQLAHLLAIQDKTVGLDEFRTSFHYKSGNKIAELGYGRIYGTIGSGAYLDNNYRHNLYSKHYFDIDMQNCHPNLILQLAKRHNIPLPELEIYVQNREEYIKQILAFYNDDNKTRTTIKTELIAVLYGAEIQTFNKLTKELDVLITVLESEHKILMDIVKNRKRKNVRGAFLSYIAQTEEVKCLDAMDSYFLMNNRSVDDLAYDGLMVRKEKGEEIFPEELLRGAEEFIFQKTGYKMKLEIKPMVQTISEELLKSQEDKKEDEYEIMKRDFEKCNAYYVKNNTILYFEKGKKIEMRTIEHTREAYGYLTVGTGRNKKSFFELWRKDANRRVISELVCKMPEEEEKGELSLFRGFGYTKYETDFEKREEHVAFFKSLVSANCNDNEESTKYVIDTFSQMLQQPFKKTGVLNAFATPLQGCGKDTLMMIVLKVIGSNHSAHYVDEVSYWDKHDTRREGAIFVYLEEVGAGMNKLHENELKTHITADVISLNPKGFKAYITPNISRIFQTTNNPDPFKISENDRRINIMTPNDRFKGSDWTAIYERYINNNSFIRNIGDYLMERDISDFQYNRFPESNYRKEMKELSEIPSDIFLKQWKPEGWTTSSGLYNAYKNFCIEQSLSYKQNSMSLCKSILPQKDKLFRTVISSYKIKHYLPIGEEYNSMPIPDTQ